MQCVCICRIWSYSIQFQHVKYKQRFLTGIMLLLPVLYFSSKVKRTKVTLLVSSSTAPRRTYPIRCSCAEWNQISSVNRESPSISTVLKACLLNADPPSVVLTRQALWMLLIALCCSQSVDARARWTRFTEQRCSESRVGWVFGSAGSRWCWLLTLIFAWGLMCWKRKNSNCVGQDHCVRHW